MSDLTDDEKSELIARISELADEIDKMSKQNIMVYVDSSILEIDDGALEKSL